MAIKAGNLKRRARKMVGAGVQAGKHGARKAAAEPAKTAGRWRPWRLAPELSSARSLVEGSADGRGRREGRRRGGYRERAGHGAAQAQKPQRLLDDLVNHVR